jgi:hypothetical protein
MIAARFPRNILIAIAGGVFFIVFGAIGFTVTPGIEFSGADGGVLFTLFELNPLQNIVHLVLGAALLGGALISTKVSALTNGIVGALFFALGFYGLFAVESPGDVFASNTWGNALHFGSAAMLLAVSLGADKRRD